MKMQRLKKFAMQKRWIWATFFVLTSTLALGCVTRAESQTEQAVLQAEQETLPIWFFHDTACGNCDGTEEFLKIAAEQISSYRDLCPYELILYNVFKSDGYASMEKIFSEHEIDPKNVDFPAMLINGTIYEGLDTIEANLKREYVSAVGSSAVYFYREDCQECIDTADFINRLPETVCVDGKELPFYLTSLNSREGDNGTVIRELFAEYEVPDEDQMVPFVFLADTYLAGQSEIENNLMSLLEEGHGISETVNIEKETIHQEESVEETDAESISEEKR